MNPPSETEQLESVIKSYRYLRLAVLVVIVALGASLVIERVGEGCRLGAISTYYHTPVHSIFIGSLVALGVVMVALRASDLVEDTLFNIAGVLAPIVALVPAGAPDRSCGPNDVSVDAGALVSNNMVALGVALLLASIVAVVTALVSQQRSRIPRSTRVALAIDTAFIIAGCVWYFLWNDHFDRWAHVTAAISMFVFIWAAAVVNAGCPAWMTTPLYRLIEGPGASAPTVPRQAARRWYQGVVLAMPVGAVVTLIVLPSDSEIFWLEVVEVAAFGVFWAVQTVETWSAGWTTRARVSSHGPPAVNTG